jgi:predicted nucleic acid-binding protein
MSKVTKDWPPRKEACVMLDSDILIELTNPKHPFHRQCKQLLTTTIRERGATVIIPQIVEFEVTSRVPNIAYLNDILRELDGEEGGIRKYQLQPINPKAVSLGSILRCLDRWQSEKETKQTKAEVEEKAFDALVGASAAVHEDATGHCTYILTCDDGYTPPYFREVSQYLLDNGSSTKRVRLFRPNSYLILHDMEKYQRAYDKHQGHAA